MKYECPCSSITDLSYFVFRISNFSQLSLSLLELKFVFRISHKESCVALLEAKYEIQKIGHILYVETAVRLFISMFTHRLSMFTHRDGV